MNYGDGPLLGISLVDSYRSNDLDTAMPRRLFLKRPCNNSSTRRCCCSLANLTHIPVINDNENTPSEMLKQERCKRLLNFIPNDIQSNKKSIGTTAASSIPPPLFPVASHMCIDRAADNQYDKLRIDDAINKGNSVLMPKLDGRRCSPGDDTIKSSDHIQLSFTSLSPLTTSNESGNFSDLSRTSTMSSENKSGCEYITTTLQPFAKPQSPLQYAAIHTTTEGSNTGDAPVIRMRNKSRPVGARKEDLVEQRFSMAPDDLFRRLENLDVTEQDASMLDVDVPREGATYPVKSPLFPDPYSPNATSNLDIPGQDNDNTEASLLASATGNRAATGVHIENFKVSANYQLTPKRELTSFSYSIPCPPSMSFVTEQAKITPTGIPDGLGRCTTTAHHIDRGIMRRPRPFTTHFDAADSMFAMEQGLIASGHTTPKRQNVTIQQQENASLLQLPSTPQKSVLRERSRIRMGVSATGRRPASMIACPYKSQPCSPRDDSNWPSMQSARSVSAFHLSDSCADLIERQALHNGNPVHITSVRDIAQASRDPGPSIRFPICHSSKSVGEQTAYLNKHFVRSKKQPGSDEPLLHSRPSSKTPPGDSPQKKRSWTPAFLKRIFRSPSKISLFGSKSNNGECDKGSWDTSAAIALPRSARASSDDAVNIKLRNKKSRSRRPLSEQICGSSHNKSCWRSSMGIWNIKEEINEKITINPDNPQKFDSGGEIVRTDPRSSSPEITPAPSEETILPIPEAEDLFLDEAPWFCAHVPRSEVLALLGSSTVGTFLVRRSLSHSGCYALSLRVSLVHSPSGLSHYLIYRSYRGYKIKGFSKAFPSVHSLITHHTILMEQLPCRLAFSRTVAESCRLWRTKYSCENNTYTNESPSKSTSSQSSQSDLISSSPEWQGASIIPSQYQEPSSYVEPGAV